MSKPETPNTQNAAPKTEAPKADPFHAGAWQFPTPEAFNQMMKDQIERTRALMDELAVYESIAVQRARTAVADLAKMASDSIGYVQQLSNEWRKLAVDASRRATEAFGPKN